MKIWNTSAAKQRELSKMLDEWAVYIRRKYGNKPLSSSTYLSEAEPFLEQYAKRSPQNQALIGSAGNFVKVEDFMAVVEGEDEEGDLESMKDIAPSSPSITTKDMVAKNEGLIVFFPGIPGCAKSALCKEILNAPGGLGDDRPVHSLMGDLIKGRYWQKVADERRKKPSSIMLADKNAPNEEVRRQIENMCLSTKASAIPVIPESEGTVNPFSIDALAVFIFRVLHRVNHPGNLDKSSPNAGYVMLMFYHLYEGRSRQEFESELIERFGSLVKMPLLKPERSPLPDSVRSIIEEGINLYKLHTNKHGRLESTKGTYVKEWVKWEKQLRDILLGNADYLNSIQVPFEFAVKEVIDQLKAIARGEYAAPTSEKRKLGSIVFAAICLPVPEILSLLNDLAQKDPKVGNFLKDKSMESSIQKAHLTLAHKRSHGVAAVANHGSFVHEKVPVDVGALLFSDKLAALEAEPGSVEGEKVNSKNQWPHVTLWTGQGIAAKDANTLPQLLSQGKANRVDINPPVTITGTLEFF
ncbi:tRNA ligase 1 isoform X1 [Capsicum annuum]|uniref:tRNA ligase 1 isoform X1 n=1 Tax=Capsicum annuum TaxID=4072 RepID=UPI001FB0C92D|nr:tRNA ligase 1 isoform X1 [Capsicum annuum]